jgi:phage tail sheath protein FI
MDEIECRNTRSRSQIEFCIDAFVEETGYITAAARSVRDPGELSPQLERIAQAMAATAGWRAWVDGDRGWFVQGRLANSSVDSVVCPTVNLIFRDHDALPVAAGTWCRSAPARWDLLQHSPVAAT